MKRALSLASGAALAVGTTVLGLAVASAPAGAAGENLTIVNAATYDYPGALFTQTVCVDGAFVANLDVGERVEVTISTGADHVVGFVGGQNVDCTDVEETTTVNVDTGEHVTAGLIWTDELQAVQWVDDTSCYQGTGRVTLRSGGFMAGDIDLRGTVDAVTGAIIASVPLDGQGSATLPAGTVISDATVTSGGNPGDVAATVGDLTVPADGDLQIYFVGGADGNSGTFRYTVTGSPCSTPTTPTTPTTAPSTTSPAPAAAAQATPRFTG